MYYKLLVFLWIIAMGGADQLRAQVEPMSTTGRASANWAYTLKGIQSSFSNQAGLAELKGFSASAYAEQTHLLPEFSNLGLAVGYSTGAHSGISLNFSSYGIEEFRQNRVGMAYGMKLTNDFGLGVQIDWYQTSIFQYGENNQLSFRLGALYRIFPDLTLGIHFSNPLGLEISDNNPIPSVFNFDLEWKVSSQLLLGAGMVKDIDEDIGVKGALHYQIHPNFNLMMGALSHPSRFSFGVQFTIGDFGIQSAASYHQFLGFSPSAGLSYEKVND
nr:hypothetical protein [Saprospiraceae bacterium]